MKNSNFKRFVAMMLVVVLVVSQMHFSRGVKAAPDGDEQWIIKLDNIQTVSGSGYYANVLLSADFCNLLRERDQLGSAKIGIYTKVEMDGIDPVSYEVEEGAVDFYLVSETINLTEEEIQDQKVTLKINSKVPSNTELYANVVYVLEAGNNLATADTADALENSNPINIAYIGNYTITYPVKDYGKIQADIEGVQDFDSFPTYYSVVVGEDELVSKESISANSVFFTVPVENIYKKDTKIKFMLFENVNSESHSDLKELSLDQNINVKNNIEKLDNLRIYKTGEGNNIKNNVSVDIVVNNNLTVDYLEGYYVVFKKGNDEITRSALSNSFYNIGNEIPANVSIKNNDEITAILYDSSNNEVVSCSINSNAAANNVPVLNSVSLTEKTEIVENEIGVKEVSVETAYSYEGDKDLSFIWELYNSDNTIISTGQSESGSFSITDFGNTPDIGRENYYVKMYIVSADGIMSETVNSNEIKNKFVLKLEGDTSKYNAYLNENQIDENNYEATTFYSKDNNEIIIETKESSDGLTDVLINNITVNGTLVNAENIEKSSSGEKVYSKWTYKPNEENTTVSVSVGNAIIVDNTAELITNEQVENFYAGYNYTITNKLTMLPANAPIPEYTVEGIISDSTVSPSDIIAIEATQEAENVFSIPRDVDGQTITMSASFVDERYVGITITDKKIENIIPRKEKYVITFYNKNGESLTDKKYIDYSGVYWFGEEVRAEFKVETAKYDSYYVEKVKEINDDAENIIAVPTESGVWKSIPRDGIISTGFYSEPVAFVFKTKAYNSESETDSENDMILVESANIAIDLEKPEFVDLSVESKYLDENGIEVSDKENEEKFDTERNAISRYIHFSVMDNPNNEGVLNSGVKGYFWFETSLNDTDTKELVAKLTAMESQEERLALAQSNCVGEVHVPESDDLNQTIDFKESRKAGNIVIVLYDNVDHAIASFVTVGNVVAKNDFLLADGFSISQGTKLSDNTWYENGTSIEGEEIYNSVDDKWFVKGGETVKIYADGIFDSQGSEIGIRINDAEYGNTDFATCIECNVEGEVIKRYTYTFNIPNEPSADGEYEFVFHAKDDANEEQTRTIELVIDNTEPIANYELYRDNPNDINEFILMDAEEYNNSSRNKKLVITPGEETSGLIPQGESSSVFFYSIDHTYSEQLTMDNVNRFSKEDGLIDEFPLNRVEIVDGSNIIDEFANEDYNGKTIYIYLFDRSGNKSTARIDVGPIIWPEVTKSFDKADNNNFRSSLLYGNGDEALVSEFEGEADRAARIVFVKDKDDIDGSRVGYIVVEPNTTDKIASKLKDGKDGIKDGKEKASYKFNIPEELTVFNEENQIEENVKLEDGCYYVFLEVDDSYYVLRGEPVELIIDNTKPEINECKLWRDNPDTEENDYTELEDWYTSTREKYVTFNATDEFGADKVSGVEADASLGSGVFYIIGEDLTAFDATVETVDDYRKQLSDLKLKAENAGENNYSIPTSKFKEDYNGQYFYLVAVDKAGNVRVSDLMHSGPVIDPEVTTTFRKAEPNGVFKSGETYSDNTDRNNNGDLTSNAILAVFEGEAYVESAEVVIEQNGTEYVRVNATLVSNDVKQKDGKIVADGKYVAEYSFNIPEANILPEGTYSIFLEVNDAGYVVSGPKSDYIIDNDGKQTIIIDNTKPVFSHTERIGNGNHIYINKSDVDTNGKVSWDYVITEKNLKNVESAVTVTDKDGNVGSVAENLKNTFNKKDDGSNTLSWSMNDLISTEGTYDVTLTATDWAGFTVSDYVNFTYDLTVPEVTSYSITPQTKTGDYSDYQLFENNSLLVSVGVSDHVSGIKRIKITGTSNDSRVANGFTDENYYNGNRDASMSYSIDIDFKGTVKVEIEDMAGNVTVQTRAYTGAAGNSGLINEGSGIHARYASLDFTTNVSDARVIDGVEYYNENVTAFITARDEISGLKNLTFTDNGNQVENWSYTGNSSIALTDDSRIHVIQSNDEGSHEIYANFTDNAGNPMASATRKTIIVDSTVPVITVTKDVTNASNFYNVTRNFNISINDKNFYQTDTKITVTKNGSEIEVAPDFATSGDISTMSYAFTDDGDYTIKVETTDKAGNIAEPYTSESFTIDKTKPVISVSYDNNDALNENYYSAERRAEIKIIEHNFDASRVRVNVKSSINGQDVESPSISEWSNSGDTHIAILVFSNDADYQLSITANDKADNAQEAAVDQKFTVDKTKPEIVITGIVDGSIYADSAVPRISISDTNFDPNNYTLTLRSFRNAELTNEIKMSYADVISNELYLNGRDFVYDAIGGNGINQDDYYELVVTAVDKAGNSADIKTVVFKINNYGSFFELDSETSGIFNNKITNLEGVDSFRVREYHLTDSTKNTHTFYLYKGEELYELKEGIDFTTNTVLGDDGWFITTYTIDNMALFADDGEYSLVVSTTDESGKTTDSSASAKLSFTLDNIKPEVSIRNVEDGKTYEDTDSITAEIEVHDNIALDHVEIWVDGEKQEYDAAALEANENKFSIKFDSREKAYTLQVVAVDVANNKNDNDDEISFTVLSGKAKKGIGSWLWLLIAAPCVVIGGIVILLVGKRKKDEKKK